MSQTPALPLAPASGNPFRAFARLARLWLCAPDRGNARLLIAILLLLTAVQVGVQIGFNIWSRNFFNALENRDSIAACQMYMDNFNQCNADAARLH
jgi:ABC-type uncharacterized transport system fused permease/ATPase subunit